MLSDEEFIEKMAEANVLLNRTQELLDFVYSSCMERAKSDPNTYSEYYRSLSVSDRKKFLEGNWKFN